MTRLLARLDQRQWIVFAGLAVLGVLLYGLRLASAPDFDVDEALYTFAGQRIALHNSISWSNQPILVHPPLYFLTVSAWLSIFGQLHAPLIHAIHTARYLNVGVCTGIALLTASMARVLSPRTGNARLIAIAGSGVFVAVNPFLLRFGRSVLIDPLAVLLGLLAVRVAWWLKDRPFGVFVPTYGTLIGLSVLCKEPAVFLSGAPFLTAVIQRNRRDLIRTFTALVMGAFVFSTFAITNVLQGQSGPLFDEQSFNIRRLLGLAQVSGLNRKGVSPTAAFTETFLQYAGGYFLLGIGGLALAALVLRLRPAGLRADPAAATLAGFGITSYVFLFYSIFIGQSNEQLTVYAVPAAALLSTMAWQFRRPAPHQARAPRPLRRRLHVATLLGSLGVAVFSWGAYMLATTDTAQSQVENFVARSLPVCAPVNATGDPFTWTLTLRTNPVFDFPSGPDALRAGVHVFLLSPKDSRFYYGHSSPQLAAYVMSHGRELFAVKSHTYDSLQVWSVGAVTSPPGFNQSDCSAPTDDVATDASASEFLLLLGGAISLIAMIGGFAEGLRFVSDDDG